MQAVLVEDPLLALLLDHTFGHLPPQALLLPGGLAALRRDFAWALRRLGLAESPHTLASLRGGGAVFEYMQQARLDRIMMRGRWDSEATLKHYLQVGLASFAYIQLAPDARTRVACLSAVLEDLLLGLAVQE